MDHLEQRADVLTDDVTALRGAVRLLIEQAVREGWQIDARAVALLIAPGETVPFTSSAGPTPPPRGRRVRGAALPDWVRARASRARAAIARLEAEGKVAEANAKRAELAELLERARLEAAGVPSAGETVTNDGVTTPVTHEPNVTHIVTDRDAHRDADRHDSRHDGPPSRGPEDFSSGSGGSPSSSGPSSRSVESDSVPRNLEDPSPSSLENHVPSTPRARESVRTPAREAVPPAAAPPTNAPPGPPDAAQAPEEPSEDLPPPPPGTKVSPRLWKAVDACADAWPRGRAERARAEGRVPLEDELARPSFARRTKSNEGLRWRIVQGCVRADGVLEARGVPVSCMVDGQLRHVRTEAIAEAFAMFAASRPAVRWVRWYDEASRWTEALIARVGLDAVRRGVAGPRDVQTSTAPPRAPADAAEPPSSRPRKAPRFARPSL